MSRTLLTPVNFWNKIGARKPKGPRRKVLLEIMYGKVLQYTINLAAIACKQGERRRITLPEPQNIPEPARNITLLETRPAVPVSKMDLPTTAETIDELKQRLGKELYRIELDLQRGARIAGKPCDCLTRAKHLGGVEAAAEELMSYENNPIYGKTVDWFKQHEPEFVPQEIANHPKEYYQGLVPEVRAFRKAVVGTESVAALLNEDEKKKILASVVKAP